MVKKAATKSKKTEGKPKPKTFHATVILNTTKAPFQVSGAFISASTDFVRIRGEIGDDIGKVIMVPQSMVKLIYLTEDA